MKEKNLREITVPASATEVSKFFVTESDILTIITPAGSKAEEIAKEKGFAYKNN